MNLKRHTFIDISDTGRETILAELVGNGVNSDTLTEPYGPVILPDLAGVRVPGIVRREDGLARPGYVPVGFSDPSSNMPQRFRIAAFARIDDVIKVNSPYEIISFPMPRRHNASIDALDRAKEQAEMLNLVLGVWGSVALELYTGLPCTYPDSDLDLIVETAPLENLSRFMDAIKGMEKEFALRIDVELDLPNGYGVQLKEVLNQGRTVLGKSISEIALLHRDQILAELPYNSRYIADDRSIRPLFNGEP